MEQIYFRFEIRGRGSLHFTRKNLSAPLVVAVQANFISSKNDAGEYFIWYAIILIILNINLL